MSAEVPVCAIHDRPEPSLPGDFRACGECCHVWHTANEFAADVRAMDADMRAFAPELPPLADPLTLGFCPLCAHNF